MRTEREKEVTRDGVSQVEKVHGRRVLWVTSAQHEAEAAHARNCADGAAHADGIAQMALRTQEIVQMTLHTHRELALHPLTLSPRQGT